MLRITDAYWDLIRKHFPEEHIPDDRPGRNPIAARKILTLVRLTFDFYMIEAKPQNLIGDKA